MECQLQNRAGTRPGFTMELAGLKPGAPGKLGPVFITRIHSLLYINTKFG